MTAHQIHGVGSFEGKSWDEKPYSEHGGTKLTHVKVSNVFHGAIEGQGTLEYVMVYCADCPAVTYVGFEHVVGRIGERSGSFVLQHQGVFEEDTAKTTWNVVPGSATGDLHGLRGEGGFNATHEQPVSFTLDYYFE